MAKLREDWRDIYNQEDYASSNLFITRLDSDDFRQKGAVKELVLELILKYLVDNSGNSYTKADWIDKPFKVLKGVWREHCPKDSPDWGKLTDQLELDQSKQKNLDIYNELSEERQQEVDRFNNEKADEFSDFWRKELSEKGIKPAASRISAINVNAQKLGMIKQAVISQLAVIKQGQFVLDEERYLYFSGRAISAGEVYSCNDNGDWFSREELRKAASTFIGVGIYCNHDSDDPNKAIGFILDSYYVDDRDFIEVIFAIDKELAEKSFPGLSRALLQSLITDLSMGCWCQKSSCSVCGNVSHTPLDYCEHIRHYKSLLFEGERVYEINENISFFELSLIFDSLALKSGINDVTGADRSAKIRQKIAGKKEGVMRTKVLAEAVDTPIASIETAKDYPLIKEPDKATADQAKKSSDVGERLGNPMVSMEIEKDYPLVSPVKISSRAWLQLTSAERKELGDTLIVPDQDVIELESPKAIEESDDKKRVTREEKVKTTCLEEVKEKEASYADSDNFITKKLLDVITHFKKAAGLISNSKELAQESLIIALAAVKENKLKLADIKQKYDSITRKVASALSIKAKKRYAAESESLAEQADLVAAEAEDLASRVTELQQEIGGDIIEDEGIIQPVQLAEKVTGSIKKRKGEIDFKILSQFRAANLKKKYLKKKYLSFRKALRQDKNITTVQKKAILQKILALGNPSVMVDNGDYQLASDVVKQVRDMLFESDIETRSDIKKQYDAGFATAEEKKNLLKTMKSSLRDKVKRRLAIKAALRQKKASDTPTTTKPIGDPGVNMKWVWDPSTSTWVTMAITSASKFRQADVDETISLEDVGIVPTEAEPEVVETKMEQIEQQIDAVEQCISDAAEIGDDTTQLAEAKETLEEVQFTLDNVEKVEAALKQSKKALIQHKLAKLRIAKNSHFSKAKRAVVSRKLAGLRSSKTLDPTVIKLQRENSLLKLALKRDKAFKLASQMLAKGMIQQDQFDDKLQEVMNYSDDSFSIVAQLVQNQNVVSDFIKRSAIRRPVNQQIPQGIMSKRLAFTASDELGEDFFE